MLPEQSEAGQTVAILRKYRQARHTAARITAESQGLRTLGLIGGYPP